MPRAYTYFAFVLILILLIFSGVNGYRFVTRDSLNLSWDEFNYYEFSIFYFNRIFHIYPPFTPLASINHKPPLLYLTTTVSYLVFPIAQDTTRITNVFYYLLLLVGLGAVEWRITKRTLFSPFLLLSVTLLQKWILRYFFPWISVAAVLIWFIFFVLTLKRNYLNSLILGGIFGLGLLAKPSFPVLGLIPLLYYLFKSHKGFKDIFLHSILLACGTILIAGWFYIPRLAPVIYVYGGNVWGNEVQENEVQSSLFTLRHFLYYFYNIHLSLLFVVAYAVSLIFLLWKRKQNLITFSFLFPFLFFSIVVFRKDIRYILPILPLMPLTIALFLNEIFKKRYQIWLLTFLLFTIALLTSLSFQLYPAENPRSSLNNLVITVNPKAVVLYSFYPRLRFNFIELKIKHIINASIIDCVFPYILNESCYHPINNSIVLYEQPYCKHPRIQYEKRFCRHYNKTIPYFKKFYGNLTPYMNLNFTGSKREHYITVLLYHTKVQ